jgi:membrane associated rhomboid family serine protease
MQPAAVGFQCPSCVKDGSRSVRSAQAPYGGRPSRNPALTTLVLIGINIAVWVSINAKGAGSILADKLSLIPAFGYHFEQGQAPTLVDGVAHGAWWQVMTSVFTHVQALHIGSNMLALYFVGPALEQVLGRVRFLALYLVSGLAGSAAVMLFANAYSPTLGASGAIFGLLGALAVITFKVGGDWRNVLTWIGLNLIITFTVPNISWEGHLGGLVAGSLIAAGIAYAPKDRRQLVQALVVVGIALISIALIVVRAHDLAAQSPVGFQ